MFEKFEVKFDYGKAILICNDCVKLNVYMTEIKPKILILKNNPEKIYGLDPYDFREEYKSELFRKIEDLGFKIINMHETIEKKIKEIIDKELNDYISENINDTKYITDFSISKYGSHIDFMRNASRFGRNIRDDEKELKKINIDINKINKGIIKIITNKYSNPSFEYNLEKDEFNIEDREIMRRIYDNSKLKLLLSYKQYKTGRTPEIYNEIAKINDFLKNKKTVTVELHNGTKIKADAYLYSILDIRENGEIFIASRYSNKIIEGNPINNREFLGTELKCLKYGRNILPIQSEALKSLKIENLKELEEDEEII